MVEYPSFGDFAEERTFDGDKLRIDQILDKKILVMGFRIKDSKQKPGTQYVTIHYTLDGMSHVTFTSSQVLMDMIVKYKDKIPFYTVIRKINSYYTFT